MRTLIDDTLAAWREAERLLETMPVGHRQQASVRQAISDIRRVYASLTADGDASGHAMSECVERLEHARYAIRKISAETSTTQRETRAGASGR